MRAPSRSFGLRLEDVAPTRDRRAKRFVDPQELTVHVAVDDSQDELDGLR